jgi:WD40 repeat protein
MYDAFTGGLRASYSINNASEEPTFPVSLAFTQDGSSLLAGYDGELRLIDTDTGRRAATFSTTSLRKEGGKRWRDGQRGIISCLQSSPDGSSTLAAGSYSGQTAVYSEKSGGTVCLLEGQEGGGITQVQYSPSGLYLFTGARRHGDILCWDVRNTAQVLCKIPRVCRDNQRIQFDVDSQGGRFLATGSQDGCVLIYDLNSAPAEDTYRLTPCYSHTVHDDEASFSLLTSSFLFLSFSSFLFCLSFFLFFVFFLYSFFYLFSFFIPFFVSLCLCLFISFFFVSFCCCLYLCIFVF